MKTQLFFTAALFAASMAPAFAQTATPSDMKTFTSSAEVRQMIARIKAEPAKPLVSEPILSLDPYKASLEYRSGAAAPAAVHTSEAELIYVIDGAGTLVVGGTLENSKPMNPTNLSGTGITGGKSVPLTKGDFTIVPQNTPHQLVPKGKHALVLMTFHVPRPQK